jgi:hypothetical protein
MQNSYSDVEQRVKRYWYTDGIGELIGGGVFLLLGLYFSIQQYFGDHSLVGVLLQSSFAVILIGLMLVGRRLINLLKIRLTYPRTGYVEYPTTEKNAKTRRVLAGAIAMGVAMGSVVIARRVAAVDSMVAITGVLVALILLVKQGWSAGMPRFYALSAVSFLLGAALSISGLPRGYNLGTFYGLMGTAFLVSGGLTLQRYLHANPMPAEDRNG